MGPPLSIIRAGVATANETARKIPGASRNTEPIPMTTAATTVRAMIGMILRSPAAADCRQSEDMPA